MTVGIEMPVTREKGVALARSRADDPSSVVEVIHPGLSADPVSGGFAFVSDRELLMVAFDGGLCSTVEVGDHEAQIGQIEQWWRQRQHRNRPLGLVDLNDWLRAAVATLVGGYDSVADLPAERRPGVTDTAVADYLLVFLLLYTQESTQQAALRAIARADWMLDTPDPLNRAIPCPLCGRPVINHKPWGYVNVCDVCYAKTTCPHGRIVTGSIISFDVEVRHVADDTRCETATRSGIVTVDGHECHIGEASIGGIFVGVLPPTME